MKNALAAIAAATLVLGGCAGEGTRETDKAKSSVSDIGSLDMRLTGPNGYVINSALYSITGGGLATPRTNTIDLTNSSQLRFQVGNLPIATGYSISLTATATNNSACSGSANFAIANNTVTTISMPLTCAGITTTDPDNNGDLRVNVAVEVVNGVACPVVTGITALPLETAVGSNIQLEGFTSQSSGVTVAWSGSGGTFSSATTAATAFTCGTGGDHDLSFAVSKAGCTTNSYSVPVTCTGATPPVDSGVPPVDSAVPPDTSVPPVDSAVPPDTSVPPVDSAVPPDTSVPPVDSSVPPDSGPGLSACQQCVRAPTSPCRDWFGGGDMVAGCFNNADPAVVESCVGLYNCAMLATDNCAADPTGVVKCFCGATPIDGACFTGSPTTPPAGLCIPQVYAASGCTTPQCVEANLVAENTAGYFGQYLTICTVNSDGCGPTCPQGSRL
jgi:hypothetical protein